MGKVKHYWVSNFVLANVYAGYIPHIRGWLHKYGCVCIILYGTFFPREEYQYLKLPTDIDDAKNLGRVLSHYKDRYYAEVLLAVFVTYILYPLINLRDGVGEG